VWSFQTLRNALIPRTMSSGSRWLKDIPTTHVSSPSQSVRGR
jgi:hypothetical protein